jgi:hypothetical protein
LKPLTIVLAAALALAACGEGADGGSSAPDTPGTGAPADGGLSVAEAKASDLDGPLMVGGLIVAEGDVVRLCDMVMESFPPQCGGESLLVEGLDLDAYETTSEGDVQWTDAPVSVLGEVDGDTLRVTDSAT